MPPLTSTQVASTPPVLFQLPTAPVGIRPERFHQNAVVLSGLIQSVWQSPGVENDPTSPPDVVATLAVYDRFAASERQPRADAPAAIGAKPSKRPAHSVTLRLPGGSTVDGQAISLGPRMRVRVTGYLRDRPEDISLQRILTNLKLQDRMESGDATHVLKSVATQVIVQSLVNLPSALSDQAADENEIQLSGIAQRIWTPSRGSARQPDLCVRLSIYDRLAEIIPPDQIGDRRRDPQGQLPTRQAHYVTLRFPAGRTVSGENVSLSPNAELRVSAYLRSVPYKQSLHEILTRLQLVDRLREDDDRHMLQRLSHYIVVGSCICFGHVPFTQLT